MDFLIGNPFLIRRCQFCKFLMGVAMYVLKSPNGHETPFYIEKCAELFKSCFGGEVVFVENYKC